MGISFNGTRQLIAVNASSGAYVNIVATGPVRRFIVKESLLTAGGAAQTPQGFTYTLPNQATVFQVPTPSTTNEPGTFPKLEIPDPEDQTFHAAFGYVLGNAADTPGAGTAPTSATVLASVRSATTTATTLEVTQIY